MMGFGHDVLERGAEMRVIWMMSVEGSLRLGKMR
jgi:hypothetical protein